MPLIGASTSCSTVSLKVSGDAVWVKVPGIGEPSLSTW